MAEALTSDRPEALRAPTERVKATAAPSAADARHLEWFAGRVGSAFAAGIVLHTGPRVFRLADRIVAPAGTTVTG